MISTRHIMSRALLVCASGFVIHTTAYAQAATPASSSWQALVGCWRPDVQIAPTDVALSDQASETDRQLARRAFALLDSARARDLTTKAPIVCIVPGARASAADVVTVDSGRVASRFTVDASGQQRPVNRDGCSGWEKAQWSQDNQRVFLRSEMDCPSGKRVVTGIMALSPGGELMDIQTVSAAGNTAVRTVRYRDVGMPSTLPADVATAVTSNRSLDARRLSIVAERDAKPISVLEATRLVDTAVVQGWLVERHQHLAVDARALVMLADAGVPSSVTDVLVALSHPEQFRFDRGPMAGEQLTRADSARIAREYAENRGIGCDPLTTYSPFGWGFDPCYDYRYGLYGDGYNRYRYGYSGYDPLYGGGYYNAPYYGYYTRPVVIVREPDTPRGRAVNGQGYTRGDGSSSSGATASRSGGSSSGASTASSSSGSSSGSKAPASTSGSSGSSSSGRTAKTRPPE